MLDAEQVDRAVGVVLASAVGDALGAGYEFVGVPEPDEVSMLTGTLTREPAGHWTDDTAMAFVVLEVAATRGTLVTTEAVIAVGEGFLEWFRSGPSDVGGQTKAVLSRARNGGDVAARAAQFQANEPDRAGNGSLMRTGPVALAHLGDDGEVARAAALISALTHPHPLAEDACVLWSLAIADAVRTGRLAGPLCGLEHIASERRSRWEEWILEAESLGPRTFNPNGFVVTALQAAWSAIHATRNDQDPLTAGLRQAVAIGDDTDTVAAIAGSLLGAAHGAAVSRDGGARALPDGPRAFARTTWLDWPYRRQREGVGFCRTRRSYVRAEVTDSREPFRQRRVSDETRRPASSRGRSRTSVAMVGQPR